MQPISNECEGLNPPSCLLTDEKFVKEFSDFIDKLIKAVNEFNETAKSMKNRRQVIRFLR